MNSLKLYSFMERGDISEGGDANELESGYYINGNFRKLTNSPFSSGWGGIVVFKVTPCVGVWIETTFLSVQKSPQLPSMEYNPVAPLVLINTSVEYPSQDSIFINLVDVMD